MMEERAEQEEIMNMMTIWSLAACWTEEPPRMAPVIIPGIDIMPRTLGGLGEVGEEMFVENGKDWIYGSSGVIEG